MLVGDTAFYFSEKQRNRKLYKEEYHNLVTRQEILQQESVSISKKISKLTSDMNKEKQQIESITKEEENIQRKIRALQQQCQVLGEHRREYERNYEEFGNQTESENKRLVLVKNSLRSVQEQIEKVSINVSGQVTGNSLFFFFREQKLKYFPSIYRLTKYLI